MSEQDPRRVTEAPAPPVSRRQDPRFSDPHRKAQLAQAFMGQGPDYDHLRPGYPPEIVDLILAAAPQPMPAPERAPGSAAGPASGPTTGSRYSAVDLGAGTGKLSRALAQRGLAVTAVDPSADMLAVAVRSGEDAGECVTSEGGRGAETVGPCPAGEVTTLVASAEHTGLPAGGAQVVTAAQAWHWFDPGAATDEVLRLLAPPSPGGADGGILALVWNTLDVAISWVHRYSRIAHAGDVQRDGFLPTVGAGLALTSRHTHRWGDPRTTWDAIDLAKTRSYYITAPEEHRARVLDNLDWYLHEYLGHEPGSTIELPYRTDLFLYGASAGA